MIFGERRKGRAGAELCQAQTLVGLPAGAELILTGKFQIPVVSSLVSIIVLPKKTIHDNSNWVITKNRDQHINSTHMFLNLNVSSSLCCPNC